MKFDNDGNLILPKKMNKKIKHAGNHDQLFKNRKLEDVRRQKQISR